MTHKIYDLAVIGGGINGAGIARDAAGRGMDVLLVEAGDFGGATSSASTKLIHGGLRYLEYYEFGLVRKALQERERLLKLAPHIIWPLEFVIPHQNAVRPWWMIRIGLFLYDHLAAHTLKRASSVKLAGSAFAQSLKAAPSRGFYYSDCWVNDARLVLLNVMDADAKGADVFSYTACTQLKFDPEKDLWAVTLDNGHIYHARQVVNATGPWAESFLKSNKLLREGADPILSVKGSHIIVKKLYEGGHAYLFQQEDRRIVFAIPYEHDYTLIGTTEETHDGDPRTATISDAETSYLLNAANTEFNTQLSAEDIVWTYSGVRPLATTEDSDVSAASRDYRLEWDSRYGKTLLNVFGGKLTTYRKLAEEAVTKLRGSEDKHWTDHQPLPGGSMPNHDFEAFHGRQIIKNPWLPRPLLYRYARAYGTYMERMLKGAKSVADLGEHYGDHVYQIELAYMIRHEYARTLEDILWRRSKLGLHISESTRSKIESALPKLLKENTS